MRDYVFSLPKDILQNHCGRCWDVANLIYVYCRHNRIPAFQVFMEYQSGLLHQTHTQCFACMDGRWIAFPDNSDPTPLRSISTCQKETDAVQALEGAFAEYLKHVLKGNFNTACFHTHRFAFEITDRVTDEEYMQTVRAEWPERELARAQPPVERFFRQTVVRKQPMNASVREKIGVE